MMSELRGVVHGKTIVLENEPGLPDGQPVAVTVHRLLPPGEGIQQSAGAWSDAADELDPWLKQMQESRKLDPREAAE